MNQTSSDNDDTNFSFAYMNAHIRASRSSLVKISPFSAKPVRFRFSSSRLFLSRSCAWARCSSSIASWKLSDPTLALPLSG